MKPEQLTAAGEPSRAERLRASPPIFPSARLDRLTRAHPATPAVLFLPVALLFAVLAVRRTDAADIAVGAVAGYVFWTLCEYWAHRVVFHFEPDQGFGRNLHWMIHGVHHDHPNDPRRLVLPPALSLPLAALFIALFFVTLGRFAWSFASAFLVGYVVYDSLHYALHHRRPKSRVGRWLHELHMRHHFQDHDTAFGVSAPWWDVVFGTRARRSAP
jgi:sterol desaturase/sphingolipid hydroxylase (fatty acid hydroxylase superfamily)